MPQVVHAGSITEWIPLFGADELTRFLGSVGADAFLQQISSATSGGIYETKQREVAEVRAVRPRLPAEGGSVSAAVLSTALDEILARLEPWTHAGGSL